MGRAVNALMGKSRAENKIIADKIIKQNPQEAGVNKSRQREIKKRFGFLRNVFYYSSGIK